MRLYLTAFPAEERRPFHLLSRMVSAPHSPVALLAVVRPDGSGGSVEGFITLWRLPEMDYVEHFAVNPGARGRGIGSEALARLGEMLGDTARPLVIEVETPADDISRRRVAFYERAGFTLHGSFRYIQPSYSASRPEAEMRLMTRGPLGSLTPADIAATLRREVYGADATSSPANPRPCAHA